MREPVARLLIEYDGSRFSGWARQPGARTVQDELERALAVVLRREAVVLTVAGRTDAGVHAWGQVASYSGTAALPRSLNALLPDDVAVLESRQAPPGFDARRDAQLARVLLPTPGPALAQRDAARPRLACTRGPGSGSAPGLRRRSDRHP